MALTSRDKPKKNMEPQPQAEPTLGEFLTWVKQTQRNADNERFARIQSLNHWMIRHMVASCSFSILDLRPSEFICGL
jgi:hypothetical protein